MRRQPYVGIQRPPFIDRHRPEPIQYGQVRFTPDSTAPPAPGGAKIKLFGFLFYTWDLGNPTNWSAIQSSRMLKGWQWAVWEEALTARILARGGTPTAEIIHGTGPDEGYVRLYGKAILDLGSMLDLVVLGHSPARSHLEYIRDNSTAPGGTKILSGMHNFESIGQAPDWNTAARLTSLRGALRPYLTIGTGPNAYGCTAIDKYEDEATGGGAIACPHTPAHAGLPANAVIGSKHTWDVDTILHTLAQGPTSQIFEDLARGMEGWIAGDDEFPEYIYGSDGGQSDIWHGAMWDVMRTAPYKGAATNDYPAHYAANPLQYAAAWRWCAERMREYWFDLMDGGQIAFWGNANDRFDIYAPGDLRNRFVEHFFRDSDGITARTWDEIAAAITRCANNGVRLILGINTAAAATLPWATSTGGQNPATNGTWAQVRSLIAELDATDYIYAPAAAAYTGGAILWQEGWREPS